MFLMSSLTTLYLQRNLISALLELFQAWSLCLETRDIVLELTAFRDVIIPFFSSSPCFSCPFRSPAEGLIRESGQVQMGQDSPGVAWQAEMIPRLNPGILPIQELLELTDFSSLEISTKVVFKCPQSPILLCFCCIGGISGALDLHYLYLLWGHFGTVQSLQITLIFHCLMGGEMHLSRWLSWAFALHPALQPLLLSRFAPQSPQTGLW